MAHKRRWWLKDEQFAHVHRKLRLNYEAALAREKAALEEERLKIEKRAADRVRELQRFHAEELQKRDELGGKLASEIARVRLEYGPVSYGLRYQMHVAMDQTFMMNAQSLKDLGPYIIEVLMAKIKREFAQIDFTRAKPEFNTRIGRPVYRFDSEVR